MEDRGSWIENIWIILKLLIWILYSLMCELLLDFCRKVSLNGCHQTYLHISAESFMAIILILSCAGFLWSPIFERIDSIFEKLGAQFQSIFCMAFIFCKAKRKLRLSNETTKNSSISRYFFWKTHYLSLYNKLQNKSPRETR